MQYIDRFNKNRTQWQNVAINRSEAIVSFENFALVIIKIHQSFSEAFLEK